MRVAFHDHRAVTQVRQEYRRDVGVILEQIAFGEAQLGPENLPEVGESDLLAIDAQDDVVLIAGNGQAVVAANFIGSLRASSKAPV